MGQNDSDFISLLNMQKEMVQKKSIENITKRLNDMYICSTCKYKGKGNPYDCFCTLYNIEAVNIRDSLVNCKKFKLNLELYSTGYYDTKKKKSYITHDGIQLGNKRKKRENHIKLWKSIIKACFDSFKINDFYPLKATLRGETYELKKTNSKSNRRSSS